MKLKVEHVTLFEYDAPIYETATEVRLQPVNQLEGPQQCENFSLEVEPRTTIYNYTDYFGNNVHHFSQLQSLKKLVISAASVVVTSSDATPASEQELATMYEYVAPSTFAVFSPPLTEFAARFPSEQAAYEPYGLAYHICQTIYQEFKYQKGVTDVNSPVDLVLELKQGVCQDFAHLMITTCRALNLPTRYVSGYLYWGDGSQEGASHAWCEVYCGAERGWVGFDPTHARMNVDERYIKIGAGRDYADVTPVRGTYKGKASESLKVSVRVMPV